MLSLKTKLATGLATVGIMAGAFAPAAFAANTITIGPNGDFSTNTAAIVKVSKSKVKQKNTTVVGTSVHTKQNTGKNHTDFNTGGGNSITTGNNEATTTVAVDGGSNTNEGENCCCDGENGTNSIDISGNGAFSQNDASIVDICKHKVKQSNTTVVQTDVHTYQNTGNNTASFNTDGSNTIDTGDNTSTTTVIVTGSSNSN